jgi:Fe-S-cluster-containing hydrogenase component 2
MKRRACLKACPDQALSADTSTTTGSTSVKATGDASRLNRSSVLPLIVAGQG